MAVCGYIYKITNLLNGKVYIGQTVRSVKIRFKQHIYDSRSNGKKKYAIHKAIQKYGENNFIVEELCVCINKDQLNRAENYYIQRHDSLNKNKGYNLKTEGCNGKLSKETKRKISTALKGKKHKKETIDKMKKSNRSKDVSVRIKARESKKTKMIKVLLVEKNIIFDCVKDTQRWLRENGYPKANKSAIIAVCRGRRNIAYNYTWRYA